MRSSIARLRQDFSRISADVSDAADGILSFGSPRSVHNSPSLLFDRRLPLRHWKSVSTTPSLHSPVNSYNSLVEIEKHSTEIENLIVADDKVESRAVDLGTVDREKKGNETTAKLFFRLQKPHNGSLEEKDNAAIKELTGLLKHFLDKELEKSNEEGEYNKIIGGLQANCEHQRAHMSLLAEALKEEITKKEELKIMAITEFQKTVHIMNNLDRKLVDCMNTFKTKGDELLTLQAALSQLYAEQEAKGKLEKDAAFLREELAKASELLKNAKLDLEKSENENQQIALKLLHSEKMLLESTTKIEELQEDNTRLHRALEHSTKRINTMTMDSENYVDRRVVVKLLITYFQRNNSEEVLDLMVRLLGFSEEEKRKIGFAQQDTGMTGVHSFLNITSRVVGEILGTRSYELSSKEPCESQSIVDTWVDFLLKETDQREKIDTIDTDKMQDQLNSSK